MLKLNHFFCLILIIITSYQNNLFAQEKFERESRIKREEVPLKALDFIDSLHMKTKIKWYKEEALTRHSIEAKFKHQKINYSVEFDTTGNIEDIEIEMDWKEIEAHPSDSIKVQLLKDCTKYKIVKVQKQFTGSEKHLSQLLNSNLNPPDLTEKYEIVVKCNTRQDVNLFEYLFDESGAFVRKAKIVFKNSSHLEY